jgi:hypothetical protein
MIKIKSRLLRGSLGQKENPDRRQNDHTPNGEFCNSSRWHFYNNCGLMIADCGNFGFKVIYDLGEAINSNSYE